MLVFNLDLGLIKSLPLFSCNSNKRNNQIDIYNELIFIFFSFFFFHELCVQVMTRGRICFGKSSTKKIIHFVFPCIIFSMSNYVVSLGLSQLFFFPSFISNLHFVSTLLCIAAVYQNDFVPSTCCVCVWDCLSHDFHKYKLICLWFY